MKRVPSVRTLHQLGTEDQMEMQTVDVFSEGANASWAQERGDHGPSVSARSLLMMGAVPVAQKTGRLGLTRHSPHEVTVPRRLARVRLPSYFFRKTNKM